MEETYKRIISRFLRLMGSVLLLISFFVPMAKAQNLRLISDDEAEQLLVHIIKPLFEAAEIPFNPNDVYIVEDNSLNAFVADGNNMFIHTGTILAADSPNEISGVLAHETGHIQGGHILRQKLKAQSLQQVSLASAILAGAAAMASGRADVAVAAVLGGQSSILTHFTHYRTEEERSADEAAINLLEKTKQSPQGMLTFMKRIANQYQLQGVEEIPYFRTHPVTRERITFFEEAVKKSPIAQDNKLQDEFERVKAKLYAYLMQPQQTLRKYPISDKSFAAKYARTIAYFKQLQLKKADKELNELLQIEPSNPYLHELKGQMYMETGKIKQAKAEYAKSLELRPHSASLQVSYAQAILEDDPTPQEVGKAISLLNNSQVSRPSGFAWLLLARAYGLQGNIAAANYASAEYSFATGATSVAMEQIKQAKKANPDERLALRISDLEAKINSVEPNKKKSD